MSKDDFHKTMFHALDFPEYYGGNLAALWDMLTDGYGMNVILIWKNSDKSQKAMGEDFDRIINVFKEYQEKYQKHNFTLILA